MGGRSCRSSKDSGEPGPAGARPGGTVLAQYWRRRSTERLSIGGAALLSAVLAAPLY